MVNNNIQGVIPLKGRGLVNKPRGNFEAGEFSIARNVEYVDDQIVSRRPFQYSLGDSGGVVGTDGSPYPTGVPFDYPFGFNGEHMRSPNTPDWRPTLLFNGGRYGGVGVDNVNMEAGHLGLTSRYLTGAVPTSWWAVGTDYAWRKVVGNVMYNGTHYRILEEYNSVTKTLKIWVNVAPDYVGGTLVVSKVLGTPPDMLVDPFLFRSFFVFKERLWIVTNNGIYFSKPTDFLTWAVPDGGFIRVQGSRRYCAKPAGDNIYIGTDHTVQMFSYTTDPNTDGYMRMLSNQGIYDIEVIQDTVFGIDADQLFQITNTNIDLIFSLSDIYENIPQYLNIKASGENLFLIAGSKNANFGQDDRQYIHKDTLEDTCMVFNIRTGFVSEWSAFVTDGTYSDYVLADIYYMKDYGSTALLFISKSTNKGLLYYMVEDNKLSSDDGTSTIPSSFRGNDQSYNLVSTSDINYPIDVELEIPDFTPDGSEYRVKKFRNLLFEGTLPFDNFEVGVAYDNYGYNDVNALAAYPSASVPVPRPPYPFRVGLNQRAKSISLRFRTTLPNDPVPTETIQHFFSLRDLRVLWTYTGKTEGGRGSATGDIVAT